MTDPDDGPRRFEDLPDEPESTRARERRATTIATVVVWIGLLGAFALFVWSGATGAPFFAMQGSVATEYERTRDMVRGNGITPYSADQYLYFLIPAFIVVVLSIAVPGPLPRRLRVAGALAAVVAIGCLVGVVGESIAAAQSVPFSNYLPRSYVGRSYVFPIAGFAIASLLFSAFSVALLWFARRLASGVPFRRAGRRALL